MIPMYYMTVMTFACINILLSLSVGVLTGYAGQISLGQAAFMGIGAYTAAFVTTKMGLHAGGIPCSIFDAIVGSVSPDQPAAEKMIFLPLQRWVSTL
jgi:ABC-type branched-subunit amino acid transport system permease subunit